MVVYTLEQRWEMLQQIDLLTKWTCDRLTEDADFGKKKIIFSNQAHYDLGGYVNKQNAYTEKLTLPKRVTV